MRRKPYKSILMPLFAAIAVIFSGCTLSGEPRVRLGSYATATPGTKFIDSNSLGRHSYGNFLFENNGIVYTCLGGHIDIAHVRICADNTRHLYNKVRKNLLRESRDFTFKLNVEPSVYYVKLEYPADWKSKSRKEKLQIIDELALEMSQYFTFTMTTWHEVLTWFGYKCMAVLPETPSAFSWEDIYSNLVGIRIGVQAIQDRKHTYDRSVTIEIRKELENLQVQSGHTARKAAEKMRGKWYDGILLVNMRERNLDIGLDDGFISPILVPGICEDAVPVSYPVPNLDKFDKYGFTMDFEVEPKEFEKGRIHKIVYPDGGPDRIEPAKQIPVLVEYIKKDLEKKNKR